MTTHTIRKGFNIRLAGRPEASLRDAPEPLLVALQPREFQDIKAKCLVKVGDRVQTGDPLLLDKGRPGLTFRSAATGKVTNIVFGERHFPEQIEVAPEPDQWAEVPRIQPERLGGIGREPLIEALHAVGLWPLIRQRPFGTIAAADQVPVAIFVNGMDTEPLAADPAFVVQGLIPELQAGIDLLKRLTTGPVYLTLQAGNAHNAALQALRGVEVQQFAGPHPAGLVGTHLAKLCPLKAGQVAWFVKAQEAAVLGQWLATGRYPSHRIVATAGSAAPQRGYWRVRAGAALMTLTGGKPLAGDVRLINGTVLSGTATPPQGYLSFYASTLTVIPEGTNRRDLVGWMLPQLGRHSASRAVFSWLRPKREYELDARLNGGPRHIVNIGTWEQMTPLDIHLSYLVRAIQANDLEQAIGLGLLELTEEDVALATFADPCKTEVGAIIRKGLDMYRKEV